MSASRWLKAPIFPGHVAMPTQGEKLSVACVSQARLVRSLAGPTLERCFASCNTREQRVQASGHYCAAGPCVRVRTRILLYCRPISNESLPRGVTHSATPPTLITCGYVSHACKQSQQHHMHMCTHCYTNRAKNGYQLAIGALHNSNR